MKKILTLLAFFSIASCASEETVAQKETTKTIKHQSASERINSTNSNSDNLFKEMDQ